MFESMDKPAGDIIATKMLRKALLGEFSLVLNLIVNAFDRCA